MKFQQVVNAWQASIGECDVIHSHDSIRIVLPNQTYYYIDLYQVYSNRKVFSMTITTFYTIQKTIEFLRDYIKEYCNNEGTY